MGPIIRRSRVFPVRHAANAPVLAWVRVYRSIGMMGHPMSYTPVEVQLS